MNTYASGNVSILRLIRYDRALTLWWPPQLVAVFLGFLMHYFPSLDSILVWAPGRMPVVFDLLYFSVLSYFVLIMFMTGVITRSAEMYMTMPVSTKRVWLARFLSMQVLTLFSVTLMTVAAAWRVPAGAEPMYLDGFMLRLGFHTGAAMALLLALVQLPFMELRRVVKTAVFAAYGAFVSLVVIGAAILTVGMTWASWAFLVCAAVTTLWILQKIPRSFSTMPAEPDIASAVDTGPEESAPLRKAAAIAACPVPAMTPLKRYITVARVLVNKWNFWLDCLMLVFYSMMAVLSFYNGSRDNPWWLFGFIWIFAALMHSISMIKKVDFLPVSRNSLFAITMTPVAVTIVLGMCIGWITVALQPGENRLIDYYDSRLQIPLEFYELSEDGPPPVLTSIWGEFHQPESYPLFGGSKTHIYRPYDTGPGSSPRFVALQIDRAVEAVHGIERNPLEKYEDLDEGFVKSVEGCCFTVSKSLGRGSDTRSRVFALAGIFSALLYASIISLQIRFSAVKRAAILIVPGTVILIMLIIGFVVITGKAGLCNPSFVEAVPLIFLRRLADRAPISTTMLWMLLAAVCAAGYFLLQSSYRRFEAPLARASKTKIA